MNSTGPSRTLDSISALRVAMRRATPSVYLDLREPRVEQAKKTAVVEESCHPTGDP